MKSRRGHAIKKNASPWNECLTQPLDQHIIENIEEAQDFATQWLWTYNNDRPNMGIGGITPAQKLKMAA